MRIAHLALPALCCVVWVGLVTDSSAQVGGGPVGNFPGLQFNPFGNSGFSPGMNGLSPQQFNNMMGMHAAKAWAAFTACKRALPIRS